MDPELDPFPPATGGQRLASKPLGPVREKWALVIGISKFSGKGVPRLNYPAKDAQDFASLLKNPKVGRFKPENVKVLLDAQATTREIKAGLNWLARSAQSDDLVVVFLSSHGSPREMDTRNVNYIVTTDTEIRPQDQLFATALAMVELTQAVRSRILAQRTVILLDTCHSGAAAVSSIPESSVAADTLDQIRQGYGRAIVTSSRVGESSYEDDDDRNGYFTFFLMQSLQQSHGLAPISRIYDEVRLKVSTTVQTKYKVSQTPVLSTSDRSGEIVIGVAPTRYFARLTHTC